MVYALVYILVLFGIVGLNIVQIVKTPTEETHKVKQLWPSTMTLYDLLEVFNRRNLHFRAIFIMRRFVVSLLYVAMRDY